LLTDSQTAEAVQDVPSTALQRGVNEINKQLFVLEEPFILAA